ncbi:helix-turn-helix domain-containing protein [Streptococcus pneumoniae]|uniref:helix-turn-helix domain-containing protein n=1 Tax=Streptococcus pneumoniae TaxID=1313 RepID=UPI0010CF9F34|nr:S24 family peptidase [Streptococcus pneumoniae]MBW5241115.1 LexA family transcriptional regulator [Streptococcus pneumoniae]MDG9016727.1 helix-turn-helix domain-containing protein [Streptococcus pneumoniae]MDG9259575.1 helix-turn-helix domain-containing protein [Streptococcus pneumoniae]VJP22894.1 phage transcriptional repressor [Streptococcus pneumoniae]VOR38167.1 phage transcriptional repressor [Streptococcus pneumoniae]
MKLGELLKSYRTEHKLSMDAFCELSDLTKGYISMLEKNEHPKSKKPIVPSYDTIEKIAKGMQISTEDLIDMLDDDQEIQINATPALLSKSPIQTIYDELERPRQGKVLNYAKRQLDEQENEEETKINEVSEVIRLYSYDYYDHPASAGTGQYLNDVRVERIELPVDVDADFVIPIKGDSMEPDYHDGDLVFIQTSVDLNDGVIGVFNYNGDAYIKQLVIDEDQAYLHSLNPEYKDMPITPDTDFRIIGEVVDLYREK